MVTEIFYNEYGEKFNIDFLPDNVNSLWGSETNHKKIYLVNGYSPFFILSESEKRYLSKFYKSILPNPTIPPGTCPVCLKESQKLEGHHVIPAMVGGSDSIENIANICVSCHSLVTRGLESQIYAITHILHSYQIIRFGLDFFLCQKEGNSRYPDRHIEKWEPNLWEIIKLLSREGVLNDLVNITVKHDSIFKYYYFRQVFSGGIPWEYIKENIIEGI